MQSCVEGLISHARMKYVMCGQKHSHAMGAPSTPANQLEPWDRVTGLFLKHVPQGLPDVAVCLW